MKNQKNVTKQQASDTHVKLTTIHINYFWNIVNVSLIVIIDSLEIID